MDRTLAPSSLALEGKEDGAVGSAKRGPGLGPAPAAPDLGPNWCSLMLPAVAPCCGCTPTRLGSLALLLAAPPGGMPRPLVIAGCGIAGGSFSRFGGVCWS